MNVQMFERLCAVGKPAALFDASRRWRVAYTRKKTNMKRSLLKTKSCFFSVSLPQHPRPVSIQKKRTCARHTIHACDTYLSRSSDPPQNEYTNHRCSRTRWWRAQPQQTQRKKEHADENDLRRRTSHIENTTILSNKPASPPSPIFCFFPSPPRSKKKENEDRLKRTLEAC